MKGKEISKAKDISAFIFITKYFIYTLEGGYILGYPFYFRDSMIDSNF